MEHSPFGIRKIYSSYAETESGEYLWYQECLYRKMEWSREIVVDLDFKSLKERAKEEGDLVFPYPLEGL